MNRYPNPSTATPPGFSRTREVRHDPVRTPIRLRVIIPLGTDRPLMRATRVTWVLLALNFAVYFLTLGQGARVAPVDLVPGMTEEVSQAPSARDAGQIPIVRSLQLVADFREPWRLITYAFLHSPTEWLHILGNMLFLYVFGPGVEDKLGRAWFLLLYLAGAIAAGLSHRLFSAAPLIGASGAIATVTGAYMVLFPQARVRTFLFMILVGVFEIPSVWFIGAAVARDVFSLGFGRGNVSIEAHLGGYLLGLTTAFTLLATRAVPRDAYDLFSVVHRKRRLREIRAAAESAQKRMQAPAKEDPAAEALATARAGVAASLARSDAPGAANAYAALLAAFPAAGRAAALTRHNQIAVANELVHSGRHREAYRAYELFLEAYPKDPQTPHTRLVLGLLAARYLSNPAAARAHVLEAMPTLSDSDDVTLARQLLAEMEGQ